MKKTISILLSVIFILTLFSASGLALSDFEREKPVIQPEEKTYCEATIEDDFAEDCVIVVLKQEASKSDKRFSGNDFKQIGCESVEDLLSLSEKERAYAEAVWEADANQRSEASTKLREENETMLNVDEFRRIIRIELA